MTSLMYDSAPGLFPASATTVALYANGIYAYPPNLVRPEWSRVLWIDVLGTAAGSASVLDIEWGDVPPDDGAAITAWCEARVKAFPKTLLRLYCNMSSWPAVKATVRGMPPDLKDRVRYWIADYTGEPHLVHGSAATQYVSGQEWDTSMYGPAW